MTDDIFSLLEDKNVDNVDNYMLIERSTNQTSQTTSSVWRDYFNNRYLTEVPFYKDMETGRYAATEGTLSIFTEHGWKEVFHTVNVKGMPVDKAEEYLLGLATKFAWRHK